MRHWLMKSEPDVFSIDDLRRARNQTTCWEGVRNYQARNFMRDRMRVGDLAFFYYSNCAEPGIAGVAEIASPAYPDHTQFDPASPYHDPGSTPDDPRWLMVDVRFREKFPRLVSLAALRAEPHLRRMRVLARGNRLSVTPVTPAQWRRVLAMANVAEKPH